jgi:hypothetical protein
LEVRYICRALAVPAACVGFASAASAVTLSTLTIQNNSTASITGGESGDGLATQTTEILSSGLLGFSTRFRSTGGVDRQSALLGGSAVATVNMDYTVAFYATHAAGDAYQLFVDTALLGALTAIDDASGLGADGSASASAVNGSMTGPGIPTGSLSLPGSDSIGGAGGSPVDLVVNRNGSATINAIGSGSPQFFTLTFTLTLTASSPESLTGGDEMAFRFGIDTPFGDTHNSNAADDYPGEGFRNGLNDGHFVTVSTVPEPGTLLCLGLGLALLAGRRRFAA